MYVYVSKNITEYLTCKKDILIFHLILKLDFFLRDINSQALFPIPLKLILSKEDRSLMLRAFHLVVTSKRNASMVLTATSSLVSIGQTAAATFCSCNARHAADNVINVCSSIDFAFSLFFLPSGCRPARLLKSFKFARSLLNDIRR